jgi:hypothetical protein
MFRRLFEVTPKHVTCGRYLFIIATAFVSVKERWGAAASNEA